MEGATFYYYDLPKNPVNDWFVAEHQKRFQRAAGLLHRGGFAAATVRRRRRHQGEVDDTES